MTIKTGSIVSHAGAQEWGAGKVLAVTAAMATIHFSDGKNRKIAASHFTSLQAASAAAYMPPGDQTSQEKPIRSTRVAKTK